MGTSSRKGNRRVADGVRRRPNGRYEAYYRENGRQRAKQFSRLEDAKRWRAEGLARGSAAAPLDDPVFERWVGEWMASKVNLRSATKDKYRSLIEVHLVPAFGAMRLSSITPSDIERFIQERMAAGKAPRTIRELYQVLNQILARAVSRDVLLKSPCVDIDLPAIPHKEQRVLLPHELRALIQATPPDHRALIATAGFLGPRWQELAALRRSRLDLDHSPPAMLLCASMERAGGRYRYTEDMKSRMSRRTLTISASVARSLRTHLEDAPPSDFVFANTRGGPPNLSNFNRVFHPARDEAGLGPDVTFHTLRHTAAGIMINSGADPYLVQRRMGHESITTTYKLYGHLWRSRESSVLEDIDRAADPGWSDGEDG